MTFGGGVLKWLSKLLMLVSLAVLVLVSAPLKLSQKVTVSMLSMLTLVLNAALAQNSAPLRLS